MTRTTPAAYAYYTEILLDQGNYEDIQTAIDMSQKAQTLDPNALETHRARGYVLFNTGNYAEAISEYQAAIAINDKLWDLHYSLGAVYKMQGEYDLGCPGNAHRAWRSTPPTPISSPRSPAPMPPKDSTARPSSTAEQALSLDPSSARLHGNLGVMLYQNDEYRPGSR